MSKLDFSHIKSKKNYYEFYRRAGELAPEDQSIIIERIGIFFPYLEDPIIELGCASGFNLVEFVKLGFSSVTGVDCSPTYLEKAKKRTKNFPQITLIESFIEDLSEDKKYNSIFLTEVLEHVIDIHVVLRKVKMLLDKDGYVFITVPSERCGTNAHVRGINPKEIVKLLKNHDLKVFRWFPDFQWLMPNYANTIRLIVEHEV